jgi:hypothetical protein
VFKPIATPAHRDASTPGFRASSGSLGSDGGGDLDGGGGTGMGGGATGMGANTPASATSIYATAATTGTTTAGGSVASTARSGDPDSSSFAPWERRPSAVVRRHHGAEDPIELLKKKLEAASYGFGRDWFKMFRKFDRDRSGGLDQEEFRVALRRVARVPKTQLSDAEVGEMGAGWGLRAGYW